MCQFLALVVAIRVAVLYTGMYLEEDLIDDFDVYDDADSTRDVEESTCYCYCVTVPLEAKCSPTTLIRMYEVIE